MQVFVLLSVAQGQQVHDDRKFVKKLILAFAASLATVLYRVGLPRDLPVCFAAMISTMSNHISDENVVNTDDDKCCSWNCSWSCS